MLGSLNPPPVKQSSTNAKTHTFNMKLKQETNRCNESKNSRADVSHNSIIMLTWQRLLKQCDSSRFRITKSQQYDMITSQLQQAARSVFSVEFKALPMTDLNEKDFAKIGHHISVLIRDASIPVLELEVCRILWSFTCKKAPHEES